MTTKPTTHSSSGTTVAVQPPHPGAEIGVTSPLRKGIHAHRVTGTEPPQWEEFQWGGQAVTACTRKPVKTYAYAFAKTHGVILCRKCFSEPQ